VHPIDKVNYANPLSRDGKPVVARIRHINDNGIHCTLDMPTGFANAGVRLSELQFTERALALRAASALRRTKTKNRPRRANKHTTSANRPECNEGSVISRVGTYLAASKEHGSVVAARARASTAGRQSPAPLRVDSEAPRLGWGASAPKRTARNARTSHAWENTGVAGEYRRQQQSSPSKNQYRRPQTSKAKRQQSQSQASKSISQPSQSQFTRPHTSVPKNRQLSLHPRPDKRLDLRPKTSHSAKQNPIEPFDVTAVRAERGASARRGFSGISGTRDDGSNAGVQSQARRLGGERQAWAPSGHGPDSSGHGPDSTLQKVEAATSSKALASAQRSNNARARSGRLGKARSAMRRPAWDEDTC
jgi:hypothetical protein